MLANIFSRVLNMSLTASIVILVVYLARLTLKKAPKIYSYMLWGLVLFRLLCPVSFMSAFSLIPDRISSGEIVSGWEDNYVGKNQIHHDDRAEYAAAVEAGRMPISAEEGYYYVVTGDDGIFEPNTVENAVMPKMAIVWILGMAAMGLYSAISYAHIRKQTRVAVPFQKNIYIADDIASPFVMGIFRPVIYLPGTLDRAEREHIVAHERHHIRRGDHIFKALGFLALTIHWFNPLVWLAFVLAGRDMEMSCDEAVIRRLGEDVRAEYSASLLNLATGKRIFAGTPLAFGEGNPTGRVRNLANWKKPAFWVVLLCVIMCVILAVCLLTNPEQADLEDMTITAGPASVGIGELEFTLPQGFSIATRESDVQPEGNLYEQVIRKNDAVVGGVYRLKSSDPNLYGNWDWVESLNIPENVPEDRVMMSVDYADFMTDVSYNMAVSYGKNGTVETIHYLFTGEEIVYDVWFDMMLLTDEDTSPILETIQITTVEASVPDEDWGVSIDPDRVSRTGATALFVYSGSIPSEEGAELTYGDFLSLDRLVDGAWVPCEELAGFDYIVSDSSYPVVDGYGMVHEWPDRFGELPDGQYRLGKQVTLVRLDGSRESRMVFKLPDSVRTGLIPLNELPELYSGEQALIDGCFVTEDGAARDNKELFQDFAVCSWNGMPGVIRIVNWHYGENSSWDAVDLSYDGAVYTISTKSDSYTFRYLKHFTGEKAWENADHDAYEYYVLVNDDSVTLQDIDGNPTNGNGTPDYWTVYTEFTYRPKKPQLPANPAQAILEFNGEQLVTTTDFDRLEKIWVLFGDAELLGYEPKTHSIGIGLNLVLKSEGGETMRIELDPDKDICRINGEYVFYGAYDEPDYIEKLWYYLGIPAWPDQVYEKYPNAFKP